MATYVFERQFDQKGYYRFKGNHAAEAVGLKAKQIQQTVDEIATRSPNQAGVQEIENTLRRLDSILDDTRVFLYQIALDTDKGDEPERPQDNILVGRDAHVATKYIIDDDDAPF